MKARLLVIAGILMLIGRPAFATALAPGANNIVPATTTDTPGSGMFLNDVLLANNGAAGQSGSAGDQMYTVWAAVYQDTGTGFLDFFYQVLNQSTSVDPVSSETDGSFKAGATVFSTDVYQIFTTTGFSIFNPTDQAASTTNRVASGTTVGFNFIDDSGNHSLDPGEYSYVKVIRTNATHYNVGNTSIQNGASQNFATFEPTVVPEPATLTLLGGGLLASASAARRRRKKANR